MVSTVRGRDWALEIPTPTAALTEFAQHYASMDSTASSMTQTKTQALYLNQGPEQNHRCRQTRAPSVRFDNLSRQAGEAVRILRETLIVSGVRPLFSGMPRSETEEAMPELGRRGTGRPRFSFEKCRKGPRCHGAQHLVVIRKIDS